jgi:predicted metal-dependent hydrolase
MAFKEFATVEFGKLKIYKRRGVRNIRLSVNTNGEVRLSLPTWMPYRAGLAFAQSKKDWVLSQQLNRKSELKQGQTIGRAHYLDFTPAPGITIPRSRVGRDKIAITHPQGMETSHSSVQKVAAAASIRALRVQAEALLPSRLRNLAESHNFEYRSVRIKRLKSRWGSCDQDKNITLSLFLMQLPWPIIDYVIIHELSHTRHLNHQPEFWQEVTFCLPNAKELRKQLRTFEPVLVSS